jgi:hypothetical protein
MKPFPGIVVLVFLFGSCETPVPKHIGQGQSSQGEVQSSHDRGIWEYDTYADELGQTREREYITNRGFIAGSFSNTTTPRAPLNAKFRIFDSNNISLQLFEYAGKDPVKALSPQGYSVSIEDAQGVQHKLKAMNYSDKIAFEKSDAATVHDILMKGGRIQFSITGDLNAATRYQFTLDNANGYDEAYRNLADK